VGDPGVKPEKPALLTCTVYLRTQVVDQTIRNRVNIHSTYVIQLGPAIKCYMLIISIYKYKLIMCGNATEFLRSSSPPSFVMEIFGREDECTCFVIGCLLEQVQCSDYDQCDSHDNHMGERRIETWNHATEKCAWGTSR
jgi:hypothetical protein